MVGGSQDRKGGKESVREGWEDRRMHGVIGL